MELMVVISIIAIISASAVALFFRSIRGTGKTQSITAVEQNAQLSLSIMERFIINARQVVDVDGAPCPNTGTTLTLLNADGYQTTFSLASGRIASNSSNISSSDITISNLQFVCTTPSGAPDNIAITFSAQHSSTSTDVTTARDFSTTASLRTYQ